MRINGEFWQMYVNDGISVDHYDRSELDAADFEKLKRTCQDCLTSRAKKWQSVVRSAGKGMIVLSFKGNRFLSLKQATDLKIHLESKGISCETSGDKELLLHKKNRWIKFVIACGSSNFPHERPTGKVMSRAERAEARARARAAMIPAAVRTAAVVATTRNNVASPPRPAMVPPPQPAPTEDLCVTVDTRLNVDNNRVDSNTRVDNTPAAKSPTDTKTRAHTKPSPICTKPPAAGDSPEEAGPLTQLWYEEYNGALDECLAHYKSP